MMEKNENFKKITMIERGGKVRAVRSTERCTRKRTPLPLLSRTIQVRAMCMPTSPVSTPALEMQ